MKIYLNFDCPGCGLTRGSICLLTGHFKEAFEYNKSVALWDGLILWALVERYVLLKDKIRWKIPTIIVFIITMVIYIIRLIEIFT